MDPQPPPVQYAPYPRPTETLPTQACPSCGSSNTREVKYTWWGGLVGPRMFNLSKCNSCGEQFNRLTRKSAKRAILIYNLANWGLVFIVLAFIWLR